MPIPIAKEQKEIMTPEVGTRGAQAARVLPIDTGLPQAAKGVTDSLVNAFSVYKQMEIDNATVRAGQLNLQLDQNLQDLMNSTERDENGEVIGFLHKEGQDAFNSLQQLDSRIAGVYNNYLKEMSQLPPVAIEKLLLQGKELVNKTQKQAFNYSFEQRKVYNKNNANAIMNNIVANASGTNGSVDKSYQQNYEIFKQYINVVYEGQSEQVKQNALREMMNKYAVSSVNSTANKHSNKAILGGGSLIAIEELKDAYAKKYIDRTSFENTMKALDKDVCETAISMSGPSRFKDAIKLIEDREGLWASDKLAYITQLKNRMKTLAKEAKKELDEGTSATRFKEIYKYPETYETSKIVGELVNNPYAFSFAEDGKSLEYFDAGLGKKIQFEEWLKNRQLSNVLKDKNTMKYIMDQAYFIQNLKNEGVTDEGWKKLSNSFKAALSAAPTGTELEDIKANENQNNNMKIKTAPEFTNAKDDSVAKNLAALSNHTNLEKGAETIFNNKTNTESLEKLKINTANMLRESFMNNLVKADGDNIWDQYDDAFDTMTNDFAEETDAWFFKGKNEFVKFITDEFKSYNNKAKENKGYYIKLPAYKKPDGSYEYEDYIYKGNINYGNIMYESLYEILGDDMFKNQPGSGLSGRYANMNNEQKQHLKDIIQTKIKDTIIDAVANDNENAISINNESLSLSQSKSLWLTSQLQNQPTRAREGYVLPFDKDNEQILKFEKNDYKTFSKTEEEVNNMSETQQNYIKGTYRRIVNSDKMSKLSSDDLRAISIGLGTEESSTGYNDSPVSNFNSLILEEIITDMNNGKLVYKNDAEKAIKNALNIIDKRRGNIYNGDKLELVFSGDNIYGERVEQYYDRATVVLKNLLKEVVDDNSTSYLSKEDFDKVSRKLRQKIAPNSVYSQLNLVEYDKI